MSAAIPARLADLLSRKKKAFAHLSIVRRDGRPHVSPVWFDYDGRHIILNTARRRVKDRAMHARREVALSIVDPDNPYRYLLVRGRVVGETEDGAYDKICDLNEKYHGRREYLRREGEVRVTYTILPEQVYPKE